MPHEDSDDFQSPAEAATKHVELIQSSPNMDGLDNPVFQPSQEMNNLGAVVQFRVDERVSKAVGAKHHPQSKHKGYPRSIGLSILYALLLVLIGLVVPTTEALTGHWLTHHFVGAFLVYIYTVSIVFLVYLQVYHVRMHKRQNHKNRKKMILAKQMSRQANTPEANILTDEGSAIDNTDAKSTSNSDDMGNVEKLEEEDVQEYIILKHGTATMSHEGTSFYLRLGCLLFAVGNLILVALKIENELSSLISTDCKKDTLKYTSVFHLGFIMAQTFFLFKTHSLVVRKHKAVVRFGLMHVLATNFCVWLRVMVEEVMHSIEEAGHHGSIYEVSNGTSCTPTLMAKASPYLFPFVLEYSLVAVATMASRFTDMNVQVTRDILETVRKALRQAYRKGEDLFEPLKTQVAGGFHKAHQGTFMGMLIMSGVIVSIVLFHFWAEKAETEYRADLTFQVCDLMINVILFVGTLFGVMQLYPLGYDLSRENSIDHYLLISSAMGLIVLELFSIAGSLIACSRGDIYADNPAIILNIVSGLLAIGQAVFQTMFIADGMQRITVNDEQQDKMPGRGAVSFLVVCNVAAWTFKSFLEKSVVLQQEELVFGSIAWPLVLDTTLPLLLFFRFHSSICLADMWRSVYEPEANVIETEFLD